VFFDAADVGWDHEPQGFKIGGRPYRPDFQLECGTFVEVKGDAARLDMNLMAGAALQLGRLLLLGRIPPPVDHEWGWVCLERAWPADPRQDQVEARRYGFLAYSSKQRLWWLGDPEPQLTPTAALQPVAYCDWLGIPEAYEAARSARFGR
jgi:hypothetical protein